MKNNWKPVILDILNRLVQANFTLVSVDNGGDEEVETPSIAMALDEINATDESDLYVSNPNGKKRWLHIVLGNEPSETIADYTCDDLLDEVCEDFSESWEGRKVPTFDDSTSHKRDNWTNDEVISMLEGMKFSNDNGQMRTIHNNAIQDVIDTFQSFKIPISESGAMGLNQLNGEVEHIGSYIPE
jgi:hypothetical protein